MKPCPVDGCTRQRGDDQVVCRPHWFRLPLRMRRTVWDLYRNAPGSPEHLAAIHEAVEWLTPIEDDPYPPNERPLLP